MSYKGIRQTFDMAFLSPLHIDVGKKAIIKSYDFRLVIGYEQDFVDEVRHKF